MYQPFELGYAGRYLARIAGTGDLIADRIAPRHLGDHLLGHGRPTVTLSDVAVLTGLTAAAAKSAMVRLRRAGQFFSPHPGLYVAVPAQYRTWGVIPGIDFIDAMMRALDRHYYVALLSAAELHGAAHQRPQVFQVMVDNPVSGRDLGRVRLRFYTNRKIAELPTQARNTATGQARVATPAVTCLDLASRPNDAGGLDNVATVITELIDETGLTGDQLAALAHLYAPASLRRLGWLLDHINGGVDTDLLQVAVATGAEGRARTRLDPAGPRRGRSDPRWGIIVNTEVEPDL
jgi:predicted transcriptional regulator of viral defense system